MCTENDARKAIVTVCRLLDRRDLITGPGGNVSMRLARDSVLITPSRYVLAEMTEEVIVKVSADGGYDDGGNAPSSELGVHLGLYARFPEAGAVIHAHPPTVLGLAAGDVDFNNVLPKVSKITPVPGGVGPMTIAMLLKNTLTAAEYQEG